MILDPQNLSVPQTGVEQAEHCRNCDRRVSHHIPTGASWHTDGGSCLRYDGEAPSIVREWWHRASMKGAHT